MRKTVNLRVVAILCISILLSCKKSSVENSTPQVPAPPALSTDNGQTMKNLFFAGELDSTASIAQRSKDQQLLRIAIQYRKDPNSKVYRYIVVEEDKAGKEIKKGYLVSLKEITQKTELFDLDLANSAVNLIESGSNAPTKDLARRSRIKVKLPRSDESYNLETPVVNLLPGCTGGNSTPVCTDWYWEVWDAETGEVYSSEYLYTTCYDPCDPNSGGGGGGGGDGSVSAEDLDDESQEILADFLSSTTVAETKDLTFAAATESKTRFQWTVVKHQYGQWSVVSTDDAVGYSSGSTGGIIYRIDHIESKFTGQIYAYGKTRNSTRLIPVARLGWAETGHEYTIASNYRSGTVTVSGNLTNFGLTFGSYSQNCTVNVH